MIAGFVDSDGVTSETRYCVTDHQGSVWLSEDPARDGTNWYGYCGNNPVMFLDSTGLTITNVFDTLHQDDSKMY